MELRHIGNTLILLIAIYFLFQLGRGLAIRYFSETFLPWVGVVFCVFLGFQTLENNNIIGLLGFIPVFAYIFFKMAEGLNWNTSVKKRAQAVFLSAGSSVVVYSITHYAFGFGITEASLGAFIAAGVLGLAGYTA